MSFYGTLVSLLCPLTCVSWSPQVHTVQTERWENPCSCGLSHWKGSIILRMSPTLLSPCLLLLPPSLPPIFPFRQSQLSVVEWDDWNPRFLAKEPVNRETGDVSLRESCVLNSEVHPRWCLLWHSHSTDTENLHHRWVQLRPQLIIQAMSFIESIKSIHCTCLNSKRTLEWWCTEGRQNLASCAWRGHRRGGKEEEDKRQWKTEEKRSFLPLRFK